MRWWATCSVLTWRESPAWWSGPLVLPAHWTNSALAIPPAPPHTHTLTQLLLPMPAIPLLRKERSEYDPETQAWTVSVFFMCQVSRAIWFVRMEDDLCVHERESVWMELTVFNVCYSLAVIPVCVCVSQYL